MMQMTPSPTTTTGAASPLSFSNCGMEAILVHPSPAIAPTSYDGFDWSNLGVVIMDESLSHTNANLHSHRSLQTASSASSSSSSFYSSEKSRSCSHDRHVAFARQLDVRVYSVVLGNHPHCPLPLELGWDYSADKCDTAVLSSSQQQQQQQQIPSSPQPRVRARSYWQRREFLHSISDISVEELEEQTQRFYQERQAWDASCATEC